jgi:antitoxin FitA
VASITLDISDIQFRKLQDLATVHGIAVEVLLKASLEGWLNSHVRRCYSYYGNF